MMLRRFATKVPVGQLSCPAGLTNWKRYVMSVTVPTIAESVSTGKIVLTEAAVGRFYEEDEIICNVESDKVTVDIRAPKAGTLAAIHVEDGATVNVGDKIFTLNDGEGAKPAAEKKAAAPAAEAPKAAAPVAEAPKAAAPKVEASKAVEAPAVITGARNTNSVRLTAMREKIAERLKSSQNTAAMLTTFNEIDMTPLINLREKYKVQFAKKHGVKLGFMSPFAKACAIALQDVPVVNASWGKGAIEYHDFVDISVAVATPKGLVVPVLRDVQNMNMAQIEKKIEDFGTRAKEGKITIPEMTGGTFTISNGGTFGSWMGTPIINPPQSAILGMHAIKKKPWVVDDEIVIRDIMAVALTYDHRLIDGRDAVTFLVKVKNLIEDPARIVLDLA